MGSIFLPPFSHLFVAYARELLATVKSQIAFIQRYKLPTQVVLGYDISTLGFQC